MKPIQQLKPTFLAYLISKGLGTKTPPLLVVFKKTQGGRTVYVREMVPL